MTGRKRATFSKTDRAQFIQIRDSEGVWPGDLVSKQSAKKLVELGFIYLWARRYQLTASGEAIASYVER